MKHLTAEDQVEVESSQATLGTISALPHDTVHLIKSCQVITSVCGLVKELIENALDAEATSLNIKLEDYGLQHVEVRDNGCGILEADMQVICRSHTTSKIVSFTDLDYLNSYGFRGEALFSLCQVGRVSITSRSSSAMLGHTCKYTAAGEVLEKKVAVCNTGTTVAVTDLFHSMPVRLQCFKEGRRRQGQLQQLEVLLRAYSVALPALHVVLQHDKCIVFQKSSTTSTGLAVRAVFPDIARSLLTKTVTKNEVCITVHLLAPTPSSSSKPPPHSRSSPDRLLLLVNSRPVHHKQIEKLTKAFYGGATEGCHGRYPAGVVMVTVPPSALDVNLEPNKDKILFRDEDAVLEVLTEILTDLYGPLEKKNREDLLVCTLTAPSQSTKRSADARDSSFDGSDGDGVNASTSLQEDDFSSKENCYGDANLCHGNGVMSTERVERMRGKFGFKDYKRKEVSDQHDENKQSDEVLDVRKQNSSGIAASVKNGSDILSTSAVLSNSVDSGLTRPVAKESTLVSSTPQCADVFVNVIGNSAAFGSLSSIDVLTQEEQNCLEEILSQSTAEENELCRDRRQLTSGSHIIPSSNNVCHNAQSRLAIDKPSLDLSVSSMGHPITSSYTSNGVASINNVQDPSLRVSAPADAAAGKAEAMRNALQTGVATETIDPVAWSKGHLLAEDGSNIENVRVASSSSSHQLTCPIGRPAESDWEESPAKRRKTACQSGGTCDDRNTTVRPGTGGNELTEAAAVKASAPKVVLNLVGAPTGSDSRSGGSLGSGEVVATSSRLRESDSDRRARLAVLSPPGVERLVLDGRPVRKPLTAFAMFAREIRNKVLGALPGAPFTEVGREIAARWKTLGTEERERFEKGAKEEQARHQEEVRKVQEGGGLPSRVVKGAHHNTSLDRYLTPVSPQLFSNAPSTSKPPVQEAKPRHCDAKPHHPEVKSRVLEVKSRQSTLSAPAVKKEVTDRPWLERSVTVPTSLQNLEQRMRRALLRAQNHQSDKTNTDYRVIGKIVYNSGSKVVTTDSSTTATTTTTSAASSPLLCYACLHQDRLYGVRSHALREVLLYCRLLETCSVPRTELGDPVPFNESTIGSRLWQTLLRLHREPHPVAAYERVTDPRLLNNGLGVVLYTGSSSPHTPTHGELQEVAHTVGFYGLADLKEVLTVLADDTGVGQDALPTQVALVQTRPIKLRHWMQGESVRMTRGCPGVTSAAEVREQLQQLRYYTTHYCRGSTSDCVADKPPRESTAISLNDGETEESSVKRTPIPVKGWPDLSVCLHETPLLHLFYNLDELPGSQ